MDWVSIYKKGLSLIKKYSYIWIVLGAGIVLMLFPGKAQNEEVHTPITAISVPQEQSLEEKLSEVLSRIDGAEKVQVLLTVAQGERIQYQYDEEQMSGGGQSWQTVIISDSNKNQEGLIQQINPPEYRGAVVLCQGADSAAIRLLIIEAVGNATGLSSDKISVLKMK